MCANEVSDFFWAIVWNRWVYLTRVLPTKPQFDAVGLSAAVTLTVLAGWRLIRRVRG